MGRCRSLSVDVLFYNNYNCEPQVLVENKIIHNPQTKDMAFKQARRYSEFFNEAYGKRIDIYVIGIQKGSRLRPSSIIVTDLHAVSK